VTGTTSRSTGSCGSSKKDPHRRRRRRVGTATRDHEHAPITARVAGLPDLFDPWRTPRRSCRGWPPGWHWSSRLCAASRSGTSTSAAGPPRRSAGSTGGRGLKARADGLPGPVRGRATRPRITLDDGGRLFVTAPVAGRRAPVTALNAQGPLLGPDGTTVLAEGLVARERGRSARTATCSSPTSPSRSGSASR